METRRQYVLDLSAVSLLGLARQLPEDSNAEREAVAVADVWLAQLDNGQVDESWREAADIVHQVVTAEEWATAVDAARGPVGRQLARRLVSRELVDAPPSMAEGRCAVLRYDTAFERQQASEVVTLTAGRDGRWRTAGYHIQ